MINKEIILRIVFATIFILFSQLFASYISIDFGKKLLFLQPIIIGYVSVVIARVMFRKLIFIVVLAGTVSFFISELLFMYYRYLNIDLFEVMRYRDITQFYGVYIILVSLQSVFWSMIFSFLLKHKRT